MYVQFRTSLVIELLLHDNYETCHYITHFLPPYLPNFLTCVSITLKLKCDQLSVLLSLLQTTNKNHKTSNVRLYTRYTFENLEASGLKYCHHCTQYTSHMHQLLWGVLGFLWDVSFISVWVFGLSLGCLLRVSGVSLGYL